MLLNLCILIQAPSLYPSSGLGALEGTHTIQNLAAGAAGCA